MYRATDNTVIIKKNKMTDQERLLFLLLDQQLAQNGVSEKRLSTKLLAKMILDISQSFDLKITLNGI